MAGKLDGKVIVVTGAAAGIGKASALLFGKEGARIIVSDVDSDRGAGTARQIKDQGGEAQFVRADVSRPSDVERLVRETVGRFDRLDGAFNNAGIEGALASTAECTEENWDRTIAINLKGVWLCLREEIRQVLRQGGGGSIVNMASVAGLVGFEHLPAYVASKHGIVGLTRTAALENASRGIRVNAVCPGVIHTEMIDRITGRKPEVETQFVSMEPMGRMGRPEEIAEAALWLLSAASSFVTGQAIAVDGGLVAR
jgi:NAD(P)-dependent dehydrogenase (short-subunit alcohol dehydrogenase family)